MDASVVDKYTPNTRGQTAPKKRTHFSSQDNETFAVIDINIILCVWKLKILKFYCWCFIALWNVYLRLSGGWCRWCLLEIIMTKSGHVRDASKRGYKACRRHKSRLAASSSSLRCGILLVTPSGWTHTGDPWGAVRYASGLHPSAVPQPPLHECESRVTNAQAVPKIVFLSIFFGFLIGRRSMWLFSLIICNKKFTFYFVVKCD